MDPGLVSWVSAPHLWSAWFDLLSGNLSATRGTVGSSLLPPLVYRMPIALALVAWGGLRDKRWTIPIGMILAAPVAGLGQIALLAALPALARQDRPSHSATDPHAAQVGADTASDRPEHDEG